jgi:hypothetical protein
MHKTIIIKVFACDDFFIIPVPDWTALVFLKRAREEGKIQDLTPDDSPRQENIRSRINLNDSLRI